MFTFTVNNQYVLCHEYKFVHTIYVVGSDICIA